MNANQLVKKNLSGMHVIKTLQVLLEDNYTMSELIQKLNENEPEPIFNNSVVSKYINTCRYCGIEIPKIHNRYFIAKLPFGLELTLKDLELLDILSITASKKFAGKSIEDFDSLMRKLSQYINKEIIRVDSKTTDITYERFEKAIEEKRKVLLMFKVKAVLECIPLAITEHRGKPSFKVFYNNKERYIGVNRVSGLKLLGKIFVPEVNESQTVLFKLKGDLAKNYTLREHEQEVARHLPEYITISNFGEDKEELLSRLLRYDKSCEIISPESYRNEFKRMLNDMLSNYGE